MEIDKKQNNIEYDNIKYKKKYIENNKGNNLYGKLYEYSKAGYVPMHMPGGKRNTDLLKMDNPYALDITEIDGFDNMHHAEGIIKDGFDKCAKLFGADESLYLINGSSAGIMAAICGVTEKNSKVIIARNVHKSVYNAVYLNELFPVYIYPECIHKAGIYGAVKPEEVRNVINSNKDAKAVVITSPTYEGVVSDIKAIAKIVHENGMVLIVDEAHGAHFNFSDEFPESAVKQGADAVIQSIHKTLPAFTQTALLHLNGSSINRERVKMYWDMFQTTSPSYILMAGIDRCMNILENNGKELFEKYIKRLKKLRNNLKTLKNINLLETDDISKIILITKDGKWLYEKLLKDYKIQLEMASISYVIAMTSICDTDEYYDRFFAALRAIDDILEKQNQYRRMNTYEYVSCSVCNAIVKLKPFDAVNAISKDGRMEKAWVDIEDAVDEICADGVCFYPPGIQLVNPGELFSREVVDIIKEGVKQHIEVIGIRTSKEDSEKIECIDKGVKIKVLCLK